MGTNTKLAFILVLKDTTLVKVSVDSYNYVFILLLLKHYDKFQLQALHIFLFRTSEEVENCFG